MQAIQQPRAQLAAEMLALAVLPGLLLLDAGLAFAMGWRTSSRLDSLLLLLAAAALLALVIPRTRRAVRERWPQFLLATGGAAFAWLLGEGLLVWWDLPPTTGLFHVRTPWTHVVHRPLAGVMPGVGGETHYTTNSFGIRGPEFPPREAAYRLLCLGGSTTECGYIHDDDLWTHLLAEKLNRAASGPPVWVGNAGIAGYSSVQHLRFVEQPDLMSKIDCLLVMVGINDLDKFLRRGGPQVSEVPTDGAEQAAPIWYKSRAIRLARAIWQARQVSRDIQIEDQTGSVYIARRQHRRQADICRQLPDLTAGLERYRERIAAMIQACRRRGVRPVFVCQPVLWDDELSPQAADLLWFGRLPDGRYLGVEQLRQGMDGYNEALRAACRAMGAACIDTTAMNGQERFFYDDCHFNVAGSRELARLIGDWFRARGGSGHAPGRSSVQAARLPDGARVDARDTPP